MTYIFGGDRVKRKINHVKWGIYIPVGFNEINVSIAKKKKKFYRNQTVDENNHRTYHKYHVERN